MSGQRPDPYASAHAAAAQQQAQQQYAQQQQYAPPAAGQHPQFTQHRGGGAAAANLQSGYTAHAAAHYAAYYAGAAAARAPAYAARATGADPPTPAADAGLRGAAARRDARVLDVAASLGAPALARALAWCGGAPPDAALAGAAAPDDGALASAPSSTRVALPLTDRCLGAECYRPVCARPRELRGRAPSSAPATGATRRRWGWTSRAGGEAASDDESDEPDDGLGEPSESEDEGLGDRGLVAEPEACVFDGRFGGRFAVPGARRLDRAARRRNAEPAVRALCGSGGAPELYAAEFNAPDDDEAGRRHAWDTVMVDDTARKMRRWPGNVLVVDEYDADAVARGDDDALSTCLDYVGRLADALASGVLRGRPDLHGRVALPGGEAAHRRCAQRRRWRDACRDLDGLALGDLAKARDDARDAWRRSRRGGGAVRPAATVATRVGVSNDAELNGDWVEVAGPARPGAEGRPAYAKGDLVCFFSDGVRPAGSRQGRRGWRVSRGDGEVAFAPRDDARRREGWAVDVAGEPWRAADAGGFEAPVESRDGLLEEIAALRATSEPPAAKAPADAQLRGDVLRAADVICCTTLAAATPQLRPLGAFRAILYDDAHASDELDALVPLLRCGCERLALCGEAVDAPRSLLHRFRSAAVEATELTRNYRQHPRLADFASRHFYGGAGGSGASAADFAPVAGLPWPRAAAPACFVETGASAAVWKSAAAPFERRRGGSFVNGREAARVALLVERALEAGLGAENIAVVAATRPQADDLAARLPDVACGAPGDFRGRAFDLVVVSCVRSNEAGDVGSDLSEAALRDVLGRATRGLVVVGSSRTVRRAAGWQQWLAWCERHRLVVDAARWREALDRAAAAAGDPALEERLRDLARAAPDGAPVAPDTFRRFVKRAIGVDARARQQLMARSGSPTSRRGRRRGARERRF
ncbi:hypothetical protein JL720_16705 [Aureococcus anophagefferens]|nr:hypothetical protein JL720_16705 [Aureococcus anophagefferens]